MEDDKSLGKNFAEKLDAQVSGLGPNFVEKLDVDRLEAKATGLGPNFVEKVESGGGIVQQVRARAGTATEGLKTTFSRLSTVVAEAATNAVNEAPGMLHALGEAVGVMGPSETSLRGVLQGIRVKDIAVPGGELIAINANQKVGELEQLLRQEHIHAVPVWTGVRYEGSVDTADLVTWAVVKFPKVSLDAWTTFREEKEFTQQSVQNVVDASWRNHFYTTSGEGDLLTVLEAFRDRRDIHRVFIRRAGEAGGANERELTGVVTQTDILRWLHSVSFDAKTTKIGEAIHAKKVLACNEEELVVSAFRLMDGAGISSAGVTDARGRLVGVISSFDIVTRSQESIISSLFKPLGSFVGRDVPNAPPKLITVKPSTSFAELLQLMTTNKILHIFMVDDDGYPTRAISLRDILEALLPAK
jgi:CBS domain-containing protein